MNKAIYFLLLISSVFSCSQKGDSTTEPEDLTDSFKTYSIDLESKAFPLLELIEEVEVLGLEETENSLLGYIFNLNSLDGKYVVNSGNQGDIFIFSSSGEFLHKFNHKGDGPGEYEYIHSIWTDANFIYVFDLNKQLISAYDIHGKFERSWKLENFAMHVRSFENGFITDLSYRPFQDSLKYNVLFLNKDNTVRSWAAPYAKRVQTPIFSTLNSFSPYRGGMLFDQGVNDTVFMVKSDQVEPILALDFGKQWLWNSGEPTEKMSDITKLIRETDLIWSSITKVNEEWIFLEFKRALNKNAYAIINRKTAAYKELDLRKPDGSKWSIFPLEWENGSLIFSISSPDLSDLISGLEPSQVRLKGKAKLEQIESSENPVLVWVKFKKEME